MFSLQISQKIVWLPTKEYTQRINHINAEMVTNYTPENTYMGKAV